MIPRCRRPFSRKNRFARGIRRARRELAAYDVLFEPCDVYQDESPTSDGLKFTVAPSWLGGLDINIGGQTVRVHEHLSTRHPLVQMLLFSGVVNTSRFREGVLLFSCPKSSLPRCVLNMVKNSGKGRPGGYSDENVQEEISKENKMDNRSGLSSAGRQIAGQAPITAPQGHTGRMPWIADQGQAASELDRTDWEQQQQQQEEGTLTGINHVADELGEMEKAATKLGDDISANSGSAISEATCKTSGALALTATEYPNDQPSLKDDAELGGQQRSNGVHDEPENISGEETQVTAEHGISNNSPVMTTNTGTTTWLMASGALHHATGNRDLLCDFIAEEHGDLFVKTGDAGAVPMRVLGRGSVVTDTVVLHDVWYVPGLAVNVVSVSQLAELDYSVAFGGGKCFVRSAGDGAVVVAARAAEDGLFALDFIRVVPPGL